MLMKICKTCGIEKPLSEFAKSTVNKLGCIPHCKKCKNWAHRSEENKERERTRWRLLAMGLKYCPCCKKIKSVSDFATNNGRKDLLRAYCMECDRLNSLEYVQRENIKKRKKERESTIEFAIKLNDYRRTSLVYNSPEKKVERLYRSRVRNAVIKQNIKRKHEYNDMLGCTYGFLREYIESKFTKGMTWNNNGRGNDKWHLDHIIPCAAFDLNDHIEQKECFHFTNLQPLWESVNLAKSSSYGGVFYRKYDLK